MGFGVRSYHDWTRELFLVSKCVNDHIMESLFKWLRNVTVIRLSSRIIRWQIHGGNSILWLRAYTHQRVQRCKIHKTKDGKDGGKCRVKWAYCIFQRVSEWMVCTWELLQSWNLVALISCGGLFNGMVCVYFVLLQGRVTAGHGCSEDFSKNYISDWWCIQCVPCMSSYYRWDRLKFTCDPWLLTLNWKSS